MLDPQTGNPVFANPANTAVGQGTSAGSTGAGQINNTVVGQGAMSNVNGGTTLGQGTVVNGNGGSALGQAASVAAGATSGVALGQFSYADRGTAVSVGSDGTNGGTAFTRQITNVAAGTQGTDAVNLTQLNAAVGGIAAAPFVADNTNGRAAPTAGGTDAAAGGYGASATGTQSIAVGNQATASVNNASAFGFNANASLINSVAIGQGSTTTAASSIAGNGALGVRNNAGAVVTGSGSVFSIGAGGAERQIQNVAAGAVTATSTNAVNGSQLFSVTTSVNAVGAGAAAGIGGGAAYNAATGAFTAPSYTLNGSGATTYTSAVQGIQALANGGAGPVQYATPGTPSNNLNLVGTGGAVTLGNVAAGTVAAGSTQAVNGGQLFATNQQIAANTQQTNTNTQNILTTNQRTAAALGGGAGVDANGLLTAPTYVVQGGTFNNVGGALGALDGATTRNTQAIGVLQGQVATNTSDITSLQNGTSGPFRANNAGGFAAPQASGANAVAGGFGAVASGTASTAIGTGAQATQAGATAIGAFAMATADPTTAVGFAAAATGNEASAFGAFATASGTNSTALGRSATATGANSVAVGFGASATQANSVAIGTGVQTTRANQVAIGTSSQTYTLAGLTSAASLAAQSGATGFVTTDAAGNLAASNYGPAQMARMDGRISTLEAGFAALNRFSVQARAEARRGIAAVAATAPTLMPSAPGKTTVTVKASTYRGEYGGGFTVAHRLDTGLPAVIFASYSNGSSRDHVVSAGAGIEF